MAWIAWSIGRPPAARPVCATALAPLAAFALVATVLVAGIPQARAGDPVTPVIDRFRTEIPRLMAEQAVPGIAVAVVDRGRPVWVEGFGHLDGPDSLPVTTDTIFSVQSTSKTFTATAVMRAVQDGLVSLDEPITTYLPEFTVHSAFEAHPERRLTLRMLLAHTAGFTHEAPVGNNNAIDPGTFDEHVRSISETWLRFPVGTGYAYSNLGIDLAGYILERIRGRPFAQLMDESLLAPLGMTGSTFDRERIRATTDRALGHIYGTTAPLVDVPMTAAGGLYTSAADLARFLSFQIDGGSVAGRSLVDPSLLEEMRTVPAPNAGAPAGYALGIARTRWRAERYQDLFSHGGGGFGFLSDLWFAPTIGIGVAILTNSSDHKLQGDLAISILRAFVDAPGSAFGQRLESLPWQGEFPDDGARFEPPSDLATLVQQAAMPPSSDESARWARFAGSYRVPTWGVIVPTVSPERFLVENGSAYFETAETGTLVRHRLAEIQPGLFLADNGEVLDLRSTPATWRNLELVPAQNGPLPWQAAILACVGIAALGWLVVTAVLALRRRAQGSAGGPPVGKGPGLAVTLTACLGSVVILATLGLLLAIPGLVDSGFVGWLHTEPGLRLALHLPAAIAVLAALLGTTVAAAWVRGAWRFDVRIRYTALAGALVGLTVQLAAWRLVGWGL